MRGLLAAAGLSILFGCASVRQVDPDLGPVELRMFEGLIAFHLETDMPIEQLRASTEPIGGPFDPGTHVWLVAAPAGEYRFDTLIRERTPASPHGERWILPESVEATRFRVVSGQINYPGLLIVEANPDDPRGRRGFVFRFVNRSAVLLQEIESRHPDLLRRFAIRYTGYGRDEFLKRLAEDRQDDPEPVSDADAKAAP